MTINLFLLYYSDLYSCHMSLLAPLARQYLDKMVDWDHGSVYKEPHAPLAPQLGLNDVDVADIK